MALAREAAAEAAARQAAALEAWEAQQKLQADENRKQDTAHDRYMPKEDVLGHVHRRA